MNENETLISAMAVLLDNLKASKALCSYYQSENVSKDKELDKQNEEIARLKSRLAGLEGADGLE